MRRLLQVGLHILGQVGLQPIRRLAMSLACSSAASYWLRYRFKDFTPMLHPSVIRSATVLSLSSRVSITLVFIQDIPLATGLGSLPSSPYRASMAWVSSPSLPWAWRLFSKEPRSSWLFTLGQHLVDGAHPHFDAGVALPEQFDGIFFDHRDPPLHTVFKGYCARYLEGYSARRKGPPDGEPFFACYGFRGMASLGANSWPMFKMWSPIRSKSVSISEYRVQASSEQAPSRRRTIWFWR